MPLPRYFCAKNLFPATISGKTCFLGVKLATLFLRHNVARWNQNLCS